MNEIVVEQQAAVTVNSQVASQLSATKGGERVAEVRAAHRGRLAYRARLSVKKRATETIELAKAEKCGAEWDGFQVEAVGLKAAVVEDLKPAEKAFRMFDIDGDGEITIDEVIEYLLSVRPDQRPEGLKDVNPFKKGKMKKKLKAMDTDGDGKLSFAEFDKWWAENHATEGEEDQAATAPAPAPAPAPAATTTGPVPTMQAIPSGTGDSSGQEAAGTAAPASS